ncbi:hypothetical protein L596_029322 [Steinernema carpocapsae]|uniref:Uncharacterized protein n=1 Tax=Steinernema carpocapsae TaxID=34508 RepID=A0A4U5LUA6_STECR|nr:hypothetical protein L596_029322 [Steinernema carpocapsae]
MFYSCVVEGFHSCIAMGTVTSSTLLSLDKTVNGNMLERLRFNKTVFKTILTPLCLLTCLPTVYSYG